MVTLRRCITLVQQIVLCVASSGLQIFFLVQGEVETGGGQFVVGQIFHSLTTFSFLE